MINAVLLDAGGVMVVPQPAEVGRVVGRYGGTTDPDAIVRAHYTAMAEADSLTGFDWPVYHRALLVECAVGTDDMDACAAVMAEAVATVSDWWSYPLAGARDGLERLAAATVVAVVSNSDGTAERCLRELKLCQVGPGDGVEVRAVVDSARVGYEKPDPRIFAHALDLLGLAAGETAYVGDTLAFDVVGARGAGLVPVHVDPYRLCPLPEDHRHVVGLQDVADLVA